MATLVRSWRATLLVCAGALACAAGLDAQRPPVRVIAVGDIHGAYTEFTTILQRAGLMDGSLRWTGGRSTLVQTGDYTDRGADVKKVLDLLMRLEREARSGGGTLLTLLGNHEVMNLIGDWRDVTPEICAAFITPQSEARRQEAWTRFERMKAGRAGRIAEDPAFAQTRDEWMQAHPSGCLEYREAMSPAGVYGRWLRDKRIAAEVDGALFMHAGINPARPARTIAEVNDRARDEIRRLDNYRRRLVDRGLALPWFTLQQLLDVSVAELRLATAALAAAKAEGREPPALDLPTLQEAQALLEIGTWSLIDPEGPLWFRGYAQWDEAATAPQVTTFLDALKLRRIVVGHTVTSTRRIIPRYEGRVLLIDTGMLQAVYKGTPSALEITPESLKALYPEGEETLPASAATSRRGSPSYSRPQS